MASEYVNSRFNQLTTPKLHKDTRKFYSEKVMFYLFSFFLYLNVSHHQHKYISHHSQLSKLVISYDQQYCMYICPK